MTTSREQVIKYTKDKLADPEFYDYGILAYLLRDLVAQENESLRMLLCLLGDPYEICTRNDIAGVLKSLEEG